MKVKGFTYGPFETNTYVVSWENAIFLIDPACAIRYEQEELQAYIEALQQENPLRKVTILATHGHLDHLWGAAWACAHWNTPVLLHEDDLPMVNAMQQQYDYFGIRLQVKPFPTAPLTTPHLPFSVIHTPGHTPGSVCLYWSEEKTLFSGDTLFKMGYGRTDLPGGNMGQLIDSLKRLLGLPADTSVYPGHGEATTIGAERR